MTQGFYKPPKTGREIISGDEQTPFTRPNSSTSSNLTTNTQHTLNDIDAALAANQAAVSQLKQRENGFNPDGGNNDNVKNREETNPLGYEPSESKQPTGFSRFFGKANLKKYGPTGGIIGLLFGGLFGIGVLFSPSLALIHLKEVLAGDLNDQVGAMEIRSNTVLRAKLKGSLSKDASICNNMVKFRCGLRTMSDRQVNNFKKAGIEVDAGDKVAGIGKRRINSMTFTDASGNKIVVDSVDKLTGLQLDSNIRSQLRRAYNPKFYSLWDATGGKAYKILRITKADKLKGTTPDKLDESFDQAMDGKNANLDTGRVLTDEEERTLTDEEKRQLEAERSTDVSESESRIRASGGFKSVLGGTVKGIGALGIADSACTVLNTSLAVEAGAKVIRAAQLATYASIFLTVADQQKASSPTLTAEKASYVGDKLMATDTNKTEINETSEVKNGTAQETTNPYYGKNAFDSEGYRAAAYNDAPVLTARAQQFMVGGALVGTLASANQRILNLLSTDGSRKSAKKKCNIVQNGFVRTGSLIVGVFAAVGSFGFTTAASVAGSFAISAALPILEGYLQDMIAGKVVGASTKGVDSGNAIFAGTSVIFGQAAQARGMQPANKEQMKSYLAATKPIRDQYIADETEMAKSTPFDIMNQYSFLGSLSRKLLPLSSALNYQSTSFGSIFSSFSTLAGNAFFPSTYAATDYNEARFSKCNDGGYADLGIDADIFCNVRYALSPAELSMDTDTVYKYMEQYVDEEGQPKDPDNLYQQWITECRDRKNGWGDFDEEEGADDGSNCLDSTAEGKKGKFSLTQLQNFRVFTMDRSIEQGMDDGPQSGETSVGDSNTGAITGRIPELAQIILDNSGTGKTFNIKGGYSDLSSNPRLAQDQKARATASLELEDIAAGKLPSSSTYQCSGGFVPTSPVQPNLNLMRFLADVGQNSGLKGIQVNSLFGQCHSITSDHYKGGAIDFGCNSAATADTEIIRKMDAIGKKYGISRNWENCAADAHWHYGVAG